MKHAFTLLGLLGAIAWTTVAGCNGVSTTSAASAPAPGAPVIAEGVIFSVEYQKPGGGTEGFTRLNLPAAVPGGSGPWNVDAYGRLTHDFLIITYPRQHELGPQVIPVSRLVSIQFGDDGIKEVPAVTASGSR